MLKKSTLKKSIKSAIRKEKILMVKDGNYFVDFFHIKDKSKDRNKRVNNLCKKFSYKESNVTLMELSEKDFYERVRHSYYDSLLTARAEVFALAILLDVKVGVGIPIKSIYIARDKQCPERASETFKIGYDPRSSPYSEEIFRAVVRLKNIYDFIRISPNGYIWPKKDFEDVAKHHGGNPKGIDIRY